MNAHSEILTAEVVQSYIEEITQFDAKVTRLINQKFLMALELEQCAKLFESRQMYGNAVAVRNLLETVGDV